MEASIMAETKVRIEDLNKHFPVNTGIVSKLLNRGEQKYVKAVDGVSLEIKEGESFGVAGESGCGKTTFGKTSILLHEPTKGEIYFDRQDITEFSNKERKKFRQNAQIVHQDPFESLNPRFKVYDWIVEPLRVHNLATKEERIDQAHDIMERVNLDPPGDYLPKYTSDLSGGERQRVAIARALITNPSFLLADEPASMLDVSIRARVLDLFKELQDEMGLTALYISHDLSLLRYVCDRIGIMYLGKLVETGPTEEIINNPKHPYTKALVSSVPNIQPEYRQEPIKLGGTVPDPVDIPDYCRFYDRCPEAMDECKEEEPPMYEVGSDHDARCILYK